MGVLADFAWEADLAAKSLMLQIALDLATIRAFGVNETKHRRRCVERVAWRRKLMRGAGH